MGQEMLTRPFPGCWEVEEDSAALRWGGGEMHAWKPKSELAQEHWPLYNAVAAPLGSWRGKPPGDARLQPPRPARQSAFNA